MSNGHTASHRATRVRLRTRIWNLFRSTRVRALLSIGIVLGFGATSTMAYWTDEATVSGVQFSSGTIDLQLNGHQGREVDGVPDPATFVTTLGMINMIPGSSVAVLLPVQNMSVGSKIRYTMSGFATGTLGAALTLKVYSGGAASNSTGGTGSCSGAQTYGGSNGIAFENTDTAILAERPTVPLAAGAGVENLCFLVTLPTGAANALQSQASTATFNFEATQVAPS